MVLTVSNKQNGLGVPLDSKYLVLASIAAITLRVGKGVVHTS